MKPICSATPAVLAAAIIASHSASVSAIGFSTKTCLPALCRGDREVAMREGRRGDDDRVERAPVERLARRSAKLSLDAEVGCRACAAVSATSSTTAASSRPAMCRAMRVGVDAAGAAGADQADANAVPAARSSRSNPVCHSM